MISLQAFATRCAESIKAGQPFIAYRHAHGTGFLKLDGGTVTEYKVRYTYRDNAGKTHTAIEKTTEARRSESLRRYSQGVVIGTRQIHKTPAKATVTGFRKAIQKMHKDPLTRGSLCTVEYDGMGYVIDGDSVGDLIREMGL